MEATYVLGPRPKKKKKNKYTREEKYKSRGHASGDKYKDLGVNRWNRRRREGVGFSRSTRFLRIIYRERVLCLLVTWEVEVEVQAWVHVSSLLLESKPFRGPLNASLLTQPPYDFIPPSNQTDLLMEVPTQSTSLLIQPLCRDYSLGGLTTSPI